MLRATVFTTNQTLHARVAATGTEDVGFAPVAEGRQSVKVKVLTSCRSWRVRRGNCSVQWE